MKLVFTRNELVTMVKTTMSLPGLMKKFLTDDYIISTFEIKMLELTKKTTAVECIKGDDDYTIAIDELFTIELINEFGSLVNAIITLTIGAGARLKMIADKYKVKEDEVIKDNTSVIPDAKRDSLIAEYGVYGVRSDINDILSNVKNTDLIKHLLVINNKKYHRQYYKTRIRHQLDDGGYIDGLILIDGAIYALYSRDGLKGSSIHTVKAYELGVVIDDKHTLGEVITDDIILLKQLGVVNPKEIYYLFFNSIDDIKNFILENNTFNISDTKDVEQIATTFYDLDNTLASHSLLIKECTIDMDVYNTHTTGLTRGSTPIDGLIYHNGKIYEIRPRLHGRSKEIYLITENSYIISGSVEIVNTNCVINIDGFDDTSAMWLLFFNDIVDMHLFLDKNFKL